MDMGSGSCKFLMLIIAFVLSSTVASASRAANIQGSQYIVKTIKIDGGDVVDCIHMYRQPAFNHPLLVNHTIQTKPSTRSNILRSKNGAVWANQSWHKNGRCPHGSIPFKRHQNSSHLFKKKYAPPAQNTGPAYHQHAAIEARPSPGTIHGIHATLNVWNPTVGPHDFSLSQLWLMAGSGPNLNTMEVGWHVYPDINGDSQTRLFIYWTSDGYHSTGCYDTRSCPGFVQTNSEFMIGDTLKVSAYGAEPQAELDVCIEKDTQTGNWWLYVGGNAIGYWPQTLFTTLANAADFVDWGGEVFDSTGGGGLHTSNQMGSGHFPDEGYQKASYIRGITYTDTSGSEIRPTSSDFQPIIILPSCYNLSMDNIEQELFLFFGGPGCQ